MKKIRSDNGSEFKNLQVEEYLEEEGVKHEFSTPYTPQQKRCGREEEQDAYRHGKDDAWRVQDARAVLVGRCEHSLPRYHRCPRKKAVAGFPATARSLNIY